MNTFNKYLNFIYEIFIIKLKVIKEYKANAYAQIITSLGFQSTLVAGFFVLKNNFSSVFYWSLKEYLFCLFLVQIFLYIFHPWFKVLSEVLLSGELNIYLVKPINIFFYYMFYTLRLWVVLFSIMHIVSFFILYWFFLDNTNLFKLLVCLGFSFLGGIFMMGTYCIADSLAFFMKRNKFFKQLYSDVNNFFQQFPITFFNQSSLFVLSYFIGYSYMGFYVTDYYFGYISFSELFVLFKILLLLIFIVYSTSYFLWKFGLKKYEAYG